MPSTKYAELSYPTHFLKSRGSVTRNNFLEYRTNKATHFERRSDCYASLPIRGSFFMFVESGCISTII